MGIVVWAPLIGLALAGCQIELPSPNELDEPCQAATVEPSADTYVEEGNPEASHGSSLSLKVDTDPQLQAYLRFELPELPRPFAHARLGLRATNGSKRGPAIFVTSSEWREDELSWSSRPPRQGQALAELGAVDIGWVEVDLDPAVLAAGPLSLVLEPASDDGFDFVAREGAAADAPRLSLSTCIADGGSGDAGGQR